MGNASAHGSLAVVPHSVPEFGSNGKELCNKWYISWGLLLIFHILLSKEVNQELFLYLYSVAKEVIRSVEEPSNANWIAQQDLSSNSPPKPAQVTRVSNMSALIRPAQLNKSKLINSMVDQHMLLRFLICNLMSKIVLRSYFGSNSNG